MSATTVAVVNPPATGVVSLTNYGLAGGLTSAWALHQAFLSLDSSSLINAFTALA